MEKAVAHLAIYLRNPDTTHAMWIHDEVFRQISDARTRMARAFVITEGLQVEPAHAPSERIFR